MLRNCNSARSGLSASGHNARVTLIVWQKPPVGFIKINTDVAIFKEARKTGTGFVVRNSNGDCLAAGSNVFLGILDPSTAEAMRIREALSWVKKQKLHSVIIESDSQLVIQSLLSNSRNLSEVNFIVNDCLFFCHSINDVYFGYCKRSANCAVHIFAINVSSIIGLTAYIASALAADNCS
ncbi:hypothetical protein K2173_011690 [Erythroxylum novogranatense]|uniref:RNase H type-1 domain-containing protein n=1 Tax=Erythroxylum novogranatense TaxID=1862640 RepID=A0AAV8T1Y1_9ROSI|nr:hypothetical protein K2173_011690 [Erythroxylum novogranatense]